MPETSSSTSPSPILAQARQLHDEYPHALILVRLGDFFELFEEDAITAAPILNVTLTGRSFGKAGRIPMCGIPHHAIHGYVKKLLAAHYTVVVWDQIEGPSQTGTPVVRAVTRVLSPGTITEDELLGDDDTSAVVALCADAQGWGVAALDASRATMTVTLLPSTTSLGDAIAYAQRLGAAEVLLPPGVGEELRDPQLTHLPLAFFDSGRARTRLLAGLGAVTLEGVGIAHLGAAQRAAGATLAYVERAMRAPSAGTLRLTVVETSETVGLDAAAMANLELFSSRGRHGMTLGSLLNATSTPMGARLLKERLALPLCSPKHIAQRLDQVTVFVRTGTDLVEEHLAAVRDIERLAVRSCGGRATARDLLQLAQGLAAIPQLRQAVNDLDDLGLFLLSDAPHLEQIQRLQILSQAVARYIVIDEKDQAVRIAPGVDDLLDAIRDGASGSQALLSSLEAREREATGIRSLKVGYTRVFGYYLEVNHAHHDLVPEHYIRRQTLTGGERYTTPELKEHEAIVLSAQERELTRTHQLLVELMNQVSAHVTDITEIALQVAQIDVACGLAHVAKARGWTRPVVDDSYDLEILGGRHPIVESLLAPGEFVPNDCHLSARCQNQDAPSLLLITGPNMAGKSTYLRQVALIALLAHMGSFVPAEKARMGWMDRIFTRVGAHDDLGAGQSTFMVEMTETATILNCATPRSLVVLDEVGRGTSTNDGLAIARSVVEALHDDPRKGCRTLFATHFRELTSLEGELPQVANAQVAVDDHGDTVVFLHHILAGPADRSYGLHVARLAGVPRSVVARAQVLLDTFEASNGTSTSHNGHTPQMSLPFIPERHPVVDALFDIDVNSLTPLDALTTLARLKAEVETP